MSKQIIQCSARVSDGMFRTRFCRIPAKIQVGANWYCPSHDPEYIQRKDKQQEEAYQKTKCTGKNCGFSFFDMSRRHYKFCPLCGLERK